MVASTLLQLIREQWVSSHPSLAPAFLYPLNRPPFLRLGYHLYVCGVDGAYPVDRRRDTNG
jgi:hypothetical protein